SGPTTGSTSRGAFSRPSCGGTARCSTPEGAGGGRYAREGLLPVGRDRGQPLTRVCGGSAGHRVPSLIRDSRAISWIADAPRAFGQGRSWERLTMTVSSTPPATQVAQPAILTKVASPTANIAMNRRGASVIDVNSKDR